MTRAEIRAEWSVSSRGIIMTPGKFEGCQDFVPHFWGLAAGGCADETLAAAGGDLDVCYVTAADRAEWPELAECGSVVLWEDDQGFVNCITPADSVLASLRADSERESCTEEA